MTTKIRPSRFEQIFKTLFVKATSSGEMIAPSAMGKEELADYRKRQMELHPSSFPYCGLRDAWSILLDEGRRREMSSLYYLNAGHAFHEAIQYGMGRTGQVIGDWKCSKCDKKHTFTKLPDPCSCGGYWKYKELGGEVKRPKWATISWHTDNLLLIRGEYWLVDYKSTGSNQLMLHRKNGNIFPYIANREQLRAYCVLVEKEYKIKVSGAALVYVGRDKPNYVNNVEVVAERVEDGDIEEWSARIVKAAKDKFIANKVREFPVKVFSDLQPKRLCPNTDFYEANVKTPWEECPLADFCQNKTRLIDTLKDELKHMKG